MILSLHMTHDSAGIEFIQSSGVLFETFQSQLSQLPDVDEYVVLWTCNRFEAYMGTNEVSRLRNELERMIRRNTIFQDGEMPAYFLEDMASIDHLFRVTSGLDSLIIGENQIQNQVKKAYLKACEEGHVGTRMHRLFSRSLKVGKRTRTESGLNNGASSVGSAAISLAEEILGPIQERTMTIIGAGEAALTLVEALKGKHPRSFFVSNRTYERAMELAIELEGAAIGLDRLTDALRVSDVVAVATSAPHPILTADMVMEAIQGREWPLVVLDLSVPSNVEDEVSMIDNVKLVRMEGLQQISLRNMSERRKQMKEAEMILMEELNNWESEESEKEAVRTISDIGRKINDIQRQEVTKALQRVCNGNDVEEIFQDFSNALVSRIIANPIMKLKEASREGRQELCDVARELFDLEAS